MALVPRPCRIPFLDQRCEIAIKFRHSHLDRVGKTSLLREDCFGDTICGFNQFRVGVLHLVTDCAHEIVQEGLALAE